ncbi:hypothetical protein K438DRAFT_1972864 [Mycena galopus ATCC 62051]|nr:hypothetical protein K438DRAFT_1972864 [Mycena galopus ATCC 62051]
MPTPPRRPPSSPTLAVNAVSIGDLPSLASLLLAYVPPSPIHPTLFPRPSLALHSYLFIPRCHTNQPSTQAEAGAAAAAAAAKATADEHAAPAKAACDAVIAYPTKLAARKRDDVVKKAGVGLTKLVSRLTFLVAFVF